MHRGGSQRSVELTSLVLVRTDGVSYWCSSELMAIFLPLPAGLTHFPCHMLASSCSGSLLVSMQAYLTAFGAWFSKQFFWGHDKDISYLKS